MPGSAGLGGGGAVLPVSHWKEGDMRSEREIRAEIERLTALTKRPRLAQYKSVNLWTRITQLEWVLKVAGAFDEEGF
jgi:hypothetical protein